MRDRRRLTLLLIPPDNAGTRTIQISYRLVKFLVVFTVVLIACLLGFGGYGWYKAAQAARVPGLEAEVEKLRSELEQVAELAASLAEAESNYKRVRHLLGIDEAKRHETGRSIPPMGRGLKAATSAPGPVDIPTSWPLVQTGFVTQEATTGTTEPHPGVDIAIPQDSYIRAAGAGVVKAAGTDEVYGVYVLIEHADGYESLYGHASRIFVAPGDSVARHEVIALSGSTGRSTAPHLHLEIRREGQAIDPLSLLRKP